jgi:tol-pal system protein YbgF
MQQDQEARIKVLEEKLSQLYASLGKMQEARIMDAEKRAKEAARRAEEAKKRTVRVAAPATTGGDFVKVTPTKKKRAISATSSAPQSTAPAAAQPSGQETPAQEPRPDSSPATTASDPLQKAKALYEAGNYKDAYRAFEQILTSDPSGDKAAETLFYMGESRFKMGEYDLAILDYQKVISNHSRHAKKAGALLKQGMAFEKLTDNETAKLIYKKLIQEHPGSAEATKAEKQLADL